MVLNVESLGLNFEILGLSQLLKVLVIGLGLENFKVTVKV